MNHVEFEQNIDEFLPLETCSVKELSALWGVSSTRIAEMIRLKKIKCKKISGKYVISRKNALDYLRANGLPDLSGTTSGKWGY
jgi:hypothetical protein